jgi:hypothetical protein
MSRQSGILNISQPYRPPKPVTGIALLFTFYFYPFNRPWRTVGMPYEKASTFSRPVVFNLECTYPRGVREHMILSTRKRLTSIKTKHRNRLNFEPALMLALTKIRPRIEVRVCRNKFIHLSNRSEPKVGNHFADKRLSLGRCSSLADSNHGVYFF